MAKDDPKHEKLMAAFKVHEHFAKVFLDAFVLVDPNGHAVKFNHMFTKLANRSSREVLKAKNIDELVTFKVGDKIFGVNDLKNYTAPSRIDEVQGDSQLGSGLNLILGIYPFMEDGKTLGYLVLIRDVTAETNLQDKYKDTAIKSITDNLTGLYTRSYFAPYMKYNVKDLDSFPKSTKVLTVCLFDIDHFKKINDTHGHQAGDHVLTEIAKVIQDNIRKTDIPCRYGGEEFLVLMRDTEIGGAVKAAENLREAIEKHTFEFEGTKIPVTVSLGLAENRTGDEIIEHTIGRADEALYSSKRGGRNRVSVHDGNVIAAA